MALEDSLVGFWYLKAAEQLRRQPTLIQRRRTKEPRGLGQFSRPDPPTRYLMAGSGHHHQLITEEIAVGQLIGKFARTGIRPCRPQVRLRAI